MTVNVSKPAINVREKLAELDKPTGIAGEAMLRAETPQEQQALIGVGRRNLIINGGMAISQRHGTTSQSPAPSGYGIDRWATYKGGAGTFSIQQSTDGPSGFSNSALITVTSNSTPSGNDYYIFQHPIEGYNISQLDWGASGAKDVTLSFWVKSSVTGTFSGSFRSSTGNYSYVFEYTVNSASTWEYKSINISGATVDTWNSTNGSGINLLFSLGQGTTYATSTVGSWISGNLHGSTTETDFIATASATFQITGVQLEVGKVATPFEHRSYGEELALCKRYFERIGIPAGSNYQSFGVGHVHTTTVAVAVVPFEVEKRASPTASYDTGSNFALLNQVGSAVACTSVGTSRISTHAVSVTGNSSGLVAGNATFLLANNTAKPFIDIDAEL